MERMQKEDVVAKWSYYTTLPRRSWRAPHNPSRHSRQGVIEI